MAQHVFGMLNVYHKETKTWLDLTSRLQQYRQLLIDVYGKFWCSGEVCDQLGPLGDSL